MVNFGQIRTLVFGYPLFPCRKFLSRDTLERERIFQMADKSMELMHELMKSLNNKMSDFSNQQKLTNERLASIEHHMAGFHSASNIHYDEIGILKDRLDRIEKRLSISDA